MSLIGSIFHKFSERAGQKHTLAEWQTVLQASGAVVNGRFQASTDTDKHHNTGRHIIGIERWGQSRLRVFLGEKLVMDEYDEYRPAADLDMDALRKIFSETRQETIALTANIQEAGISPAQTVAHNDMGNLTVRGWLAYLNGHASRESGRL
ncbi:MAG: hypothetical protein IAF02_01685 [Anaerolineae bacterium]|nr:hypothetical protein [Anaerolineae bacterium]